MLVIKVDRKHVQDIESAHADWRASLSPIEWQETPSVERIEQYDEASPVDGTAAPDPVYFIVAPRFAEFLKIKHVQFNEVKRLAP